MLRNRELKQEGIDLSKSFALESHYIFPSKNKSISEFIESEALPKTTFHQVNKVFEKKDEELVIYYLKENSLDSVVSELEAACASFYKFFANDYIPATYAVYNNAKKYIGVASEEIPGFNSLAIEPLKEEELKVEFLIERNISIEYIEKLDKELHKLEEQRHFLERCSLKLDWNEKGLKKELKEQKKHVDELKNKFEINSKKKAEVYSQSIELEKKIENFYIELESKHNIRKPELNNFRIVKGLACSLTTSYIFMEDDLHQNNLTKTGKRIDFDMSLWPLLYHYKDSNLTYLRKPSEDSFKVSERDIIHFPILKDAVPSYWPTQAAPAYSSSFASTISSLFPLFFSNAYPKEANVLYQKLEKNHVFTHYKYDILSKFVLTNTDVYKSIAQNHIRKERNFELHSMIDYIADLQAKRINQFENELLKIPEFCGFFKKHHERIEKELLQDIKLHGVECESKQIEIARKLLLKTIDLNLKKIVTSKISLERKESKDKMKAKCITFDSFEETRKTVDIAMINYLNPTFSFMRKRTHESTANAIRQFCLDLKSESKNLPLENMKALYKKLIEEKDKILNTSGGMYTELSTLLTLIKEKLPEGELGALKNVSSIKIPQ